MIPNIAQSIHDVLKSASPEQKIVWQQVRLLTGENAAVQQVNYSGLIAGSMFATYDTHILYLALQFYAGFAGNPVVTNMFILFFDELNTQCFAASNSDTYYNTTIPEIDHTGNMLDMRNFFFGRVSQGGYTYMKFIGFRFDY